MTTENLSHRRSATALISGGRDPAPMTRPAVTLVIADAHPLLLHGLSELIKSVDGISILATAPDGKAALKAVLREKPDVVVLDVNIPQLNGIDILRKLSRNAVATKVIFLSATMADSQVLDSVIAGVSGIVFKDCAPEYLVDCLRVVAAGGKCLPLNRVNESLVSESRLRREEYIFERLLSPRETAIVKLVAIGLPNKVLALKLKLSEATVKLHLRNIYKKLGITNRTELAARALKPAQMAKRNRGGN